jgi:hypothetical protein
VTEAVPSKLDPKNSNSTVLVAPGETVRLVPTYLGELESKPLQISLPFQRILRRLSLPVHEIPTPVMCSVRSPLLVTSTDTVSPSVSSSLVSQSQTSGGVVLVGGGAEVALGGGGEVLVGGGEVLEGGGVLVGGMDDGVAVAAVVGEGDGGEKEAV